MLEQNSFCTTADSTSWLSGNRYGRVGTGKHHVNQIKAEVRAKYDERVIKEFAKYDLEPRQTTVKYTTDAVISAMLCKKLYEQTCGNQD